MTKQNTTAVASFINDVNTMQNMGSKAENGAADLACHLIAAIVETEQGSNSPLVGYITKEVADEDGKRDETIEYRFDYELVTKFAQGEFNKAEVGEVLTALAGVSPNVQAAREQVLKVAKANKDNSGVYGAELAAARAKANTMTQPLRRALRAAAALIASPHHDEATAHAKTVQGSRVIRIMHEAGEGIEPKEVSVATTTINKLIDAIAVAAGNKEKRAPQQSSNKPAAANTDNAAVTISKDSVGNDKAKRNVGAMMSKFAELLGDMDHKFDPAESEAAIMLIDCLIDGLSDARQAEVRKAISK